MSKPGEMGGRLRRLVHQTRNLEDVKSFGGRLDQGFGGGWKLPGDVVQQKSQRRRTKIVLVIMLIVPLSASVRRFILIGRRIVREPTPLAGRSITPLARRMPKRTLRRVVGPSPRWTSGSRVAFWTRRTWLDRCSSNESLGR